MNATRILRVRARPTRAAQVRRASSAAHPTALLPGPESSWRATVLDYPTAPRGLEAVETLISSVEELVCRLPTTDSQIGRLRTQATNALAAAKVALAGNITGQPDEPETGAGSDLDAWVRKWPRAAVAVAVTLGLAIGVLTVRGLSASRRSD
jgi:ElaB/YqjD/DUF883 family membrane-anchored ribosome-binding protein